MSSTIDLGLKFPVANIALFLAFQIDQSVVCQTNKKPLRILAFLAASFNIPNKVAIDGGITVDTSSHLKISIHTIIAHGQCKKR
jgi:hypothetical protein